MAERCVPHHGASPVEALELELVLVLLRHEIVQCRELERHHRSLVRQGQVPRLGDLLRQRRAGRTDADWAVEDLERCETTGGGAGFRTILSGKNELSPPLPPKNSSSRLPRKAARGRNPGLGRPSRTSKFTKRGASGRRTAPRTLESPWFVPSQMLLEAILEDADDAVAGKAIGGRCSACHCPGPGLDVVEAARPRCQPDVAPAVDVERVDDVPAQLARIVRDRRSAA